MMRLKLLLGVCFAIGCTGLVASPRVDRFGQTAEVDFAGKV